MESNERYYRRRAVEERMAAQRAMTEQARAWHSKLAADFADRAQVYAIIPASSLKAFRNFSIKPKIRWRVQFEAARSDAILTA